MEICSYTRMVNNNSTYKIIKNHLSENEINTLIDISNTIIGWSNGRQGTGYKKLCVKYNESISELIKRSLNVISNVNDLWDAWIIKYPNNSFIPSHKDEASIFGMRHVRVNTILTLPKYGGDFILNNEKINLDVGTGIMFYPDDSEHSVSIVNGERLVFSVGCWI